MVAIVVRENGNDTYYYTYTDHLGSILTVTNSGGGVVAEQSFDAWGRYRDVNTWSSTTAPSGGVWSWLTRGYTGHEHLRPFALINMNGRLYDPALGRVLSPDNYVQDPFFTQNYNRYSYAYNNPLVYNDPDGEWLNFVIGAALGGFSGWRIGKAQGATGWEMAGYIFGGAAIGTITSGLGSSIVSSFGWAAQSGASLGGAIAAYGTAGAVSGAVSGAGFAALAGGNVWEGMGKGALFGGITGVAGGYLQHLRFEKSIFDFDRYNAQFEDGPIARELSIPDGVAVVKGERYNPYKQSVQKSFQFYSLNKELFPNYDSPIPQNGAITPVYPEVYAIGSQAAVKGLSKIPWVRSTTYARNSGQVTSRVFGVNNKAIYVERLNQTHRAGLSYSKSIKIWNSAKNGGKGGYEHLYDWMDSFWESLFK